MEGQPFIISLQGRMPVPVRYLLTVQLADLGEPGSLARSRAHHRGKQQGREEEHLPEMCCLLGKTCNTAAAEMQLQLALMVLLCRRKLLNQAHRRSYFLAIVIKTV